MIFLIASHSFLVRVELDTSWHVKSHQVINTGHHYGIGLLNQDEIKQNDKKKDTEFVVYRGGRSHAIQDNLQLMKYKGNDSIELIDSIPIDPYVYDVHQIVAAQNGIYIANTNYNSIIYQRLYGEKLHEYFFESRKEDWNHVNSIYPSGKKILVLLHNKSRKESELVIFNHDVSTGFRQEKVLSLWHGMCHNLFIDGDYLFYNASAAAQLIVVDLRTERVVKSLSYPHYHTKGISVTQDYIIIGLAEHTSNNLKRSATKGYLAVIDRRSFAKISTIDVNFPTLQHPIGNINEVRCISEYDWAHANTSASTINWSELKLAQSTPVQYHLTQAKMKLVKPIRNLKRYWEKRTVGSMGSFSLPQKNHK